MAAAKKPAAKKRAGPTPKKPGRAPRQPKKLDLQPAPFSRAGRIIAFAERYLRVPEGRFVGQPIKLEQFQIDFIRDVYNNPDGTKKAILSMPRKNGKTALIAILVLAHLIGPEARQNSQIVSGAMSREQASIVFDLACKMIYQSPEIGKLIRVVPSGKKLYGMPMNVEYKALSAEGKTAHGLSPVLAIMDEVGQVVGPKSDFIDAIITAQGAHDNPLQLVISTQAANDSDLLSIWIDDALNGSDKRIVCHLHTAPADCDVLDEKAWFIANPALGKFLSVDFVRESAQEASRMPSMEATFRNLLLNQRVATNSPFISKTTWLACAGNTVPIEECDELFGGLDLSAKTDLTAFILYGWHGKTGTWNVYCWIWTPARGLQDRAKRDKAPYDVWVKQGFMETTPGATVDYEWVANRLAEITAPLSITAIAFDRWRMDVLKKELERTELELPLVDWGQGYKDMSPALDAIEGKILNGTLRHGGHPVLTMCAANAMVMKDPAGNRKLDKLKTSGRIDAIVALAMGAGVAERQHEPEMNIDAFLSDPIVL